MLKELRDKLTKSSNASSLIFLEEIAELLPQPYQGDFSRVRTRMHYIRAMLLKCMATGESAAVAIDLPVQKHDTAIMPPAPDGKDAETARLKDALKSSQQADKQLGNGAMTT